MVVNVPRVRLPSTVIKMSPKRHGLFSSAKRFDSNAELSDAVSVDPGGIGFVGLPDILLGRGVVPHKVRGYGPAVTVASNETARGREKNRRVEVWLR